MNAKRDRLGEAHAEQRRRARGDRGRCADRTAAAPAARRGMSPADARSRGDGRLLRSDRPWRCMSTRHAGAVHVPAIGLAASAAAATPKARATSGSARPPSSGTSMPSRPADARCARATASSARCGAGYDVDERRRVAVPAPICSQQLAARAPCARGGRRDVGAALEAHRRFGPQAQLAGWSRAPTAA